MEVVMKKVSPSDPILKELEEKKSKLRRKIERMNNRKKRDTAKREYDRITSMIVEIKNPNPMMLQRYE